MSEWHMIPPNDSKEHTESLRCDCNPRVVREFDGLVIVHHPFDDREE